MTTSEVTPSDAARPRTAAADGDADAYRFGRPPENLPDLEPAPPTRVADMAGLEIVDVDLRDARQRKRFLDMADVFYEGDPNYIAPLRIQFMKFLDPGSNPCFKYLDHRAMFVVKDGVPVARIVAHVDKAYSEHHGIKTGFFGFFESANDQKVAHALLGEATRWLRERGCVEVFGPMNFSTNHQVGLLVENFSRPPFVENTYNPAYYEELLTSFGFAKAKDLLTWMIDTTEGMDSKKRARIRKVADRVRKREGVTVRPVKFSDTKTEIARMYDLYTKAWEKNWGFAPLGREEFDFMMADLKTGAIADLVLFVEFEGRPVGFCATLPNINEKMPKNGRLLPFAWVKMLNL
ncbi:MAG: GNAT family N-acetyltransferase, partial [Myxococcota bacterium]